MVFVADDLNSSITTQPLLFLSAASCAKRKSCKTPRHPDSKTNIERLPEPDAQRLAFSGLAYRKPEAFFFDALQFSLQECNVYFISHKLQSVMPITTQLRIGKRAGRGIPNDAGAAAGDRAQDVRARPDDLVRWARRHCDSRSRISRLERCLLVAIGSNPSSDGGEWGQSTAPTICRSARISRSR